MFLCTQARPTYMYSTHPWDFLAQTWIHTSLPTRHAYISVCQRCMRWLALAHCQRCMLTYLLEGKLRVQKQRIHTTDDVERRPHLVAHRCEKLRLGLIRRVRLADLGLLLHALPEEGHVLRDGYAPAYLLLAVFPGCDVHEEVSEGFRILGLYLHGKILRVPALECFLNSCNSRSKRFKKETNEEKDCLPRTNLGFRV